MRIAIRVCSTLMLIATALAGRTSGQQNAEGLPWSVLEASEAYRPALDRMWRSSPTFRRQCHRLAAAGRALRVRVQRDLEYLTREPSSFRARTTVTQVDGARMSAIIYLNPSVKIEELLAHEIEHILEQLDGVDLVGDDGKGMVWQDGANRFETRRATLVGRLVAREVGEGGRGRVSDVPEPSSPPLADRLMTIPQRSLETATSLARTAA